MSLLRQENDRRRAGEAWDVALQIATLREPCERRKNSRKRQGASSTVEAASSRMDGRPKRQDVASTVEAASRRLHGRRNP